MYESYLYFIIKKKQKYHSFFFRYSICFLYFSFRLQLVAKVHARGRKKKKHSMVSIKYSRRLVRFQIKYGCTGHEHGQIVALKSEYVGTRGCASSSTASAVRFKLISVEKYPEIYRQFQLYCVDLNLITIYLFSASIKY